MPEFELAELDYESLRESANVVNVERPPNAKALKGRKTSPLTGSQVRKVLIESDSPERETRKREPGKHRG
ncbi:hypothetical protein ACFYW8_35320, partial [Streptomyces sp. NPDC002742]|uniref:hypothetical protein n=1 Tax=Streptomyces sp. NPDC002742 TaxID=3364663 RepID=UPI0036A08826